MMTDARADSPKTECLWHRSAGSGGIKILIREWRECKKNAVEILYTNRMTNVSEMSCYAVWCSGSALVAINEVNLCWARLVLGWVTVSGFSFRCGTSISVCNQSPRSTHPGRPFVGRRNEYQLKGGDALQLGSKGRYGLYVGGM